MRYRIFFILAFLNFAMYSLLQAQCTGTLSLTVTDTATATTGGPNSFTASSITPSSGFDYEYNVTICSRGQIIFSITGLSGLGSTPYSWSNTGGASVTVVGTSSSLYTLNLGSGSPAGFEVECTITCSNATTKKLKINVTSTLANPNLNLSSSPISSCVGRTITLTGSCNVTGCNSVSYYYYNNNTSSYLSSGASYTTPSLTAGTYSYHVVAKNIDKCYSNLNHSVTVYGNPILSTVSASNRCVGQNAITTWTGCSNCNVSTATYSWEIKNPANAVVEGPNNSANPTWSTALIAGNNYTAVVTVTDNGICTATTSSTFNVFALPTITATASGTTNSNGNYCTGSSINLGYSGTVTAGIATASWTSIPASNINNPSSATTIDLPGNSGSTVPGSTTRSIVYTLNVTDNNGCTDNNNQVTVTIEDTLSISLAGVTTICENGSVTLTASSNQQNISFPANNSHSSGPPNNSTNASFDWERVSASGPAPANYSADNTNSISLGPYTSAGTYTYYLKVNPASTICDSRKYFNVVVNPLPAGSVSASSTLLCSGENFTLTGNISSGVFSRWEKNGVTITSATTSVLTTSHNNIGVANETVVYTLVLTSGPCEIRLNQNITFKPKVTVVLTSLSAQCSGVNLTVPISVSPSIAGMSYSWQNGSTASSFTINSPAVNSTQSVHVTVTLNGCSDRDTATYSFIDCGAWLPSSSVSSNANRACEGDVVVLSVINPTALASGFNYIYTYWSTGNFSYNGGSISIPVNATSPDTMVVYAYSYLYGLVCYSNSPFCMGWYAPGWDCCDAYYNFIQSNVDSFKIIKVKPRITVSPSDSVEYCYGQNINLQANCSNCSGTASYQWNIGGSGLGPFQKTLYNDTSFYLVTTDYNCTDTTFVNYIVKSEIGPSILQGDSLRFCSGDFFSLSSTSLTCNNCTNNWSNGASGQNITDNRQGVYILSVTNNGCTESDTVNALFHNSFIPIIEDTLTGLAINGYLPLCNQSRMIRVRPSSCPGCNLTWNNGVTSPVISVSSSGGYYVIAVDTNGCDAISPPIIAMPSLVGQNSVISSNPIQSCNQEPFTISVTPCPGCSYNWIDNSSLLQVATNSQSYTTADTGSYYAEVINQDGCRYNSNVVTVNPITIQRPGIYSNTDSICNGSFATLRVVSSAAHISYKWFRNGNLIGGATDSVYLASLSGSYFAKVTFSNGCELNSDTLSIGQTNFNPILTATNSVVCQGSNVVLSISTAPSWNYQWFRNGNSIIGATSSSYAASLDGVYYASVTNNFGCTDLTDTFRISVTSLGNVNAVTNRTEICPGEVANLSVTLCAGCSYQWFNAVSGGSLTSSTTGNFNYSTTSSGSFYVRASNGTCFVNSDTITINALPVVVPALNTSSSFICNGQTATLITSGCPGCIYTWLRDGSPIFGALNDTFFIVSNTVDTGQYQVLVRYTNGCSDTSSAVNIADGSYNLQIKIDTSAGDSVVCNNSAVIIEIDSLNSSPLSFCALGCNFQWIENSVPIVPSNTARYNTFVGGTGGGFYKLLMTDSRGCIEESNLLRVEEVNLSPIVNSSSSSICGNNAILLSYPDSVNCNSCTYEWQKGGSAALFGFANAASYVSDTGLLAVGVYGLEVTQSGCTALSNLISLNQISGLNIPIASTDLNICDGDTTTIFRVGGSCLNCQFQWLENNIPMAGATTPSLTVSNPGIYSLQMITGNNGCSDTSVQITLLPIPSPIDSFSLSAANISPLTGTGTAVDLHGAIFPPTISLNDSFYSQPFNAALGLNSGLSGPDNQILTPLTAGAGYHRIFYRYDTLGCKFTYDDILFVFADPSVNIINENPSAPQYEACVSDTVRLELLNIPFQVNMVKLFDASNNYLTVPVISNNQSFSIFGLDTVWNGTIRFAVPDWAQSSFMMLNSLGNQDTFITPFILIHNSNLDIAGLPNVICSNAAALPLSGIPSGGFFSAQYHSGSTFSSGTPIPSSFSGSNFNAGAMSRASYGSDQIQNIRVVYNFVNTYSNGLSCPQVDTISRIVEARAVFLDSVKFNPISVSQERELLENLVYRVYPYTAQPSQWAAIGSIGFSGNFTFPAGNPADFLPDNAGIGKHAMTYSIQNGNCINTKLDSIQVIAAPNSIGIPDSICRNQTFANFGRQTGLYSYFDGPNIPIQAGVFFSDTINFIRVSTSSGAGLTTINNALNLEQYNYSPAAVPGNFDTLRLEYWYKKIERVGGLPIDTIQYVVGSVIIPIFIENPFVVDIIDSIVPNTFCEVNQLNLLAGTPNGGLFTLQGGTSAYSSGAVLQNNILNPFSVHSPESSTTNYNLTYTVQGAVCQNSDTKIISIPEPISPAFATASNKRIFCQTDPAENVISVNSGPITRLWLINGVAQAAYVFNPNVLNPGNQIVSNIITDTVYRCTYIAVDTFKINPLPQLSVSPLLDTAYCTNEPNDTIRVSPNPICAQFVSGGLTMLYEGFEGLSFPWVRANTGTGNTWVRNTVLPYAGLGTAFVNTSNTVEDAWMFTPSLALNTGQTYQINLFAASGNCSPPPCLPARFKVKVAQGQTIATHTAVSSVLIADTSIAHTFYQPYSFLYTHTGLSGNFNFSFQCNTGIDGRSLTFDDISIVNTSVSGCVAGGVGTMVGPGISYLSDSTYAFNPRIVSPGNYNIRYVYTDAVTGCSDSLQMPVRIKAHPLPSFTNLASQYCDNAASVQLSGNPAGGTFSSSGPNLILAANVFDPNTGFNNEIVSYTYTDLNTRCTTTIRDTTNVIAITDSARISTINPAGYCVNVDSVVLNVQTVFGTPGVGSFFGTGVRNGNLGPLGARFYPDTAVIDGGRYGNFMITYVYPTTSGCVDTARAIARVNALPDLSFVSQVPVPNRLPDSVCLNAGIIQVRVNNRVIRGALGEIQFDTLIPIGPPFLGGGTFNPTLGVRDTLNPIRFGRGWHPISYAYTDANGCSSVIRDSFRVDTIPIIRFEGLQSDRIYCENDVPGLLLAYPPYYPGSGFLQLSSGLDSIIVDSSFYLINPAIFADSTNTNRRWDVIYTFEDLNFCASTGRDSFFVRPYPRISMTLPPTFCSSPNLEPLMPFINPQGGIFTDNLLVSSIVNNQLNLAGSSGPRRIYYNYVDTVSSCQNTSFQDISVYNTPDVDFYAIGGCVRAPITFISDSLVNNLNPQLDSITQIEWIFGDGNSVIVSPTNPVTIPNQVHTYTSDAAYQVQMAVTNQGQCTDTVSRQLIISPMIDYIASSPYVETFQSGSGAWYQEQPVIVPDSLAIWQRAELIGRVINDPGNFAWVTKPNAPFSYGQNERAWVYSPCFDFSNAKRPMIVMDIWRDFLTDIDGSVLEYYDDRDAEWKPVGETNKGVNWYQTDFLVSRPGNQPSVDYPRGWTGESGGWEKVRYRLDQFARDSFVRFRIAFASDPNTVIDPNDGFEGMAFDSVWIGERSKNLMIEHFSNFYHVTQQGQIMDSVDQFVYNTIYNPTNGRDVSLIQYQTDIAGLDPINAQYSSDFDARVLYYGINANSQFRMDGLAYGSGRSQDLNQGDLDFNMLQFPLFDIQVDPLVVNGNTVQVNTNFNALTGVDSSDYSFTIAITEDEVYNNRAFPMKAVLRKFLPDATGYSYQQEFIAGQSFNHSASYLYPFGNINPLNLQAVVYLQNNANKEVLQVATTRDLSIYNPIGTEPIEENDLVVKDIQGMNVFPNPASSVFFVSFEQELRENYQWNLVDLLGRVLSSGKATEGTKLIELHAQHLSEGTYFFTIQNQKVYAQRKVVIRHRP